MNENNPDILYVHMSMLSGYLANYILYKWALYKTLLKVLCYKSVSLLLRTVTSMDKVVVVTASSSCLISASRSNILISG